VDKLKEELQRLTSQEVQLNIHEIKRPELDAVLVADNVARQIESKVSFRRAMKRAITSTMRMGAEGSESDVPAGLEALKWREPSSTRKAGIPLHTLRADIDYARTTATTTYGSIGIKVWICKGELFGTP